MTMEPNPADPGLLPIAGVTLFTSGVAYIERAGDVEGSATVPLTFRTAQVNDVLKSMVLLDEAGTVQPVTYGARDPISRTLQSFAVDVTHPLSRAELLNRLRGTPVAVQTATEPERSGRVLGVESITEYHNEMGVERHVLTLLAEDGVYMVRLEDVRALRILDARLDRELREALAVLASGSDDQRRQVTLRFDGEGRRRVRVGYIAEAPLWKMSYRLVMDEGERPYLQGWALVENTTDDDWSDIRLSLVSGRPISFIQDLYQPLYLPRPEVAPDIVASPAPQIHGAVMEQYDEPEMAMAFAAPAGGGTRSAKRERGAPMAFAAPAPAPMAVESAAFRGSVASQAQGQSAGELFQYDITTPVSLRRQQAAMIPVVADDIDGEKLSLYNPDVDPRFPLNAVRMRNTTPLHLKGGPVTLFDDGVYAGDARMEDIPPGDSRLLSYAVDLSIEGERQRADRTRFETEFRLRRGVLTIKGHIRQETVYTLKSKAKRPRRVLIEHPFDASFNLTSPSAVERTSALYRFAVEVPAGEGWTLTVVEEQPLRTTVAVLDTAFETIQFYSGHKAVSDELRAALNEQIERRREIANLEEEQEARRLEIEAIDKDQARIRKNMSELEKTTPLYQRYVGELDEQETRIQSLRAEVRRLQGEIQEARRRQKAHLDALDIAG